MSQELTTTEKGLFHEPAESVELTEDATEPSLQYLGFELAGEVYCVDILSVNEIRGWYEPTKLPNSPEYIKGVINIRGDIIPVNGMRERFKLGARDYDENTAVIILHTGENADKRSMGFIVDGVSDVFNISESMIRKPAQFGGSVESEFVKGLVNVEDQVVVVLDVDMLLNIDRIKQHYAKLIES